MGQIVMFMFFIGLAILATPRSWDFNSNVGTDMVERFNKDWDMEYVKKNLSNKAKRFVGVQRLDNRHIPKGQQKNNICQTNGLHILPSDPTNIFSFEK